MKTNVIIDLGGAKLKKNFKNMFFDVIRKALYIFGMQEFTFVFRNTPHPPTIMFSCIYHMIYIRQYWEQYWEQPYKKINQQHKLQPDTIFFSQMVPYMS